VNNFMMFALTPKQIQIAHVVSVINSRGYKLHQFEKLSADCWLVCYWGSELIQIAKQDDFEIQTLSTLEN
jgi:hypothetical protein